MFDHASKDLEVPRQKYSAARRLFSSLLGVYKCGETRSFEFDILRQNEMKGIVRITGRVHHLNLFFENHMKKFPQ